MQWRLVAASPIPGGLVERIRLLAISKAPVAVVALGNPMRRDEGLPLRVMGRVRTLIGEIGCARHGTSVGVSETANGTGAAGAVDVVDAAGVQGSLALATRRAPGAIVDWIECATESTRLDPILDNRRRIVLIDTVTLGEKPGTVFHWHLEGQGRLTLLRHYGRAASMKMEHLAFWLEDDLPQGGIDLIGIEPADTEDGEGISRSVRHRLPTICAQTAALLFRILVEEGW
jgi:hydrogenase maturation protease